MIARACKHGLEAPQVAQGIVPLHAIDDEARQVFVQLAHGALVGLCLG